jgi:hypothetical protein
VALLVIEPGAGEVHIANRFGPQSTVGADDELHVVSR